MSAVISTHCLIFSASCAFVADQVWICACQSGRACGLVRVHHDLVFGGFGHGIEVVIVHPLAVMMFAARDYVAYISTLDCIVAVVFHKFVCILEMAFVVAYGRRCLVMHHQLHAFRRSIIAQFRQVEIRVGGYEVEYIVFGLSEPVLPAFVPAFDEYLVEAVIGSEVDIAFHIFRICGMASVWFCSGVVGDSEFHGVQFVCIVPRTFASDHIPPYTYVLHRFDP